LLEFVINVEASVLTTSFITMKTLVVYIVFGILLMGIIAGSFAPDYAQAEIIFTSGPLLGLFMWALSK